ncbi:MAG: Snf7 family protein [Nitrososphaerota archaeon]|nr:Snf7 family protein [Nitrososphaerales archaeon]MCX8191377.1 Snf7 family protein [Nitrososphaerales archaeon]MDW8044261.1 Snf7 family protein [Nitrososphaerota archaeon]
MSQFKDKWDRSRDVSLKEKITESFKTQEPLRLRLEQATRRIQTQISKLDATLSRLKERDSSLFRKVVAALQTHDNQTALALSNEIVEIRKMVKMVTQAKIALERVVLRLETVREIGDFAVTLTPAVGIIKSIRSGLINVMPEAEHEISEINSLLSSILVDAGQLGGLSLNFEAANEDAEKILNEASAVAEQKMREKFPELPIPSNVSEQSQQT